MQEDILFQQIDYASKGNQLITFTIDKELYGVEILKVQELIGFREVTPAPNAPPFIIGVINLRGNIIPVIDLRIKFNMTEKEYDKFNVIIVLHINNRTISLVVDSVKDVVSIPEEELKEPPKFVTKIDTAFIKCISKIDEKLVVILNSEKLLYIDEIENI